MFCNKSGGVMKKLEVKKGKANKEMHE